MKSYAKDFPRDSIFTYQMESPTLLKELELLNRKVHRAAIVYREEIANRDASYYMCEYDMDPKTGRLILTHINPLNDKWDEAYTLAYVHVDHRMDNLLVQEMKAKKRQYEVKIENTRGILTTQIMATGIQQAV